MTLQPDFPPSLVLLARLMGETLGGDPVPETQIGPDLAALALRRHDVGGLLYATAKGGRHQAAPEILESLERCHDRNIQKQRDALARLDAIAACFGKADIPWLVLKGAAMAAMLYADPAWRGSADIDILVSPKDFFRAASALEKLGYMASNPPLAENPLLRWLTLAAVRDLELIARDDHACALELHQRPFFALGPNARGLKFLAAPGPMPAMRAGPDLALYLILHGAISYWVRLKWLVDLVPLLNSLSDADKAAVAHLSRHLRAEPSLAATLWLLRSLFPSAALGPLASWLEPRISHPAVQARILRYCRMLSLDRDWRSSPLDNRSLSFEANWRAFDGFSSHARILLCGPVSSLTRHIAGRVFKAERALTVGTAPP